MTASMRDWFSSVEWAGLQDFWRVYDANHERLEQATMTLAMRDAEFGPMLAAIPAEQLKAQQLEGRERMARAIAGDWTSYGENIRAQGAAYAAMGISFSGWYRLLRLVGRETLPLLVREYSAEPDRLSNALLAMQAYFDWAMAQLGESYLAAKETALQKARDSLAATLDNMHEGVVMCDATGTVVYRNAVAEAIRRTAPENFRRAGDSEPLPPREYPIQCAARGELLREVELFLRNETHPDGAYYSVNASPIRDATGKLTGAISTFRDVTFRRTLEEQRIQSRELQLRNRQIEEANRLKSEFLANMSHEFRTPLNAILGFAGILYDREVLPESPEYQEFLGDILASGKHLLGLINDVLDLAKVEAGKLDFHPESIDVGALTHEVVAILRTTAASKRIAIRIEFDRGQIEVTTDASRLKQVLYNYLSNALKFTPDDGRITVRGGVADDAWFFVEVEDNGPGIAEADLGRLFTEFQQLDSGTTKKHAGTGLGLALTKRLVEAQGGHVSVRSVVGAGSVFRVDLPLHATRGEPIPSPRVIDAAPGAPAILVIEDNAADQDLIVHALTDAGYAVETASTGLRAIARCRERAFDAITLDLLLPDVSGLEVLRSIRSDGKNRGVPVVVVTVVAERGALSGFAVHDVLAKPLDTGALVRALERVDVAGPPRSVLVVDDDAGSLRLMTATLEQLGYKALCFERSTDGLEAAREKPPAALVLDLLMPEIDGFEFLKRFRRIPGCEKVPVIVWSAKDLSRDEATRLLSSAQSVIQKGTVGRASVIDELKALLAPAPSGIVRG